MTAQLQRQITEALTEFSILKVNRELKFFYFYWTSKVRYGCKSVSDQLQMHRQENIEHGKRILNAFFLIFETFTQSRFITAARVAKKFLTTYSYSPAPEHTSSFFS